jgi:leucyl aminopeptidase
MVLADTLAIAANERPDLIIDYATLTGACVGALTSRYSGIFSNRAGSVRDLLQASESSGERIWPFPLDEDFDESLRSDIADIKQCAVEGAGDHIFATRFLRRFVPEDIAWVHMDLSAGQHKGGLGAIATDITGFGVAYTLALLGGDDPSALAAGWQVH